MTGPRDPKSHVVVPSEPAIGAGGAGPLVSVVIPAHDAEKTLPRALKSVLCQDGAAMEVIVVDDGSHDSTADVARAIADARVRVISTGQNGGAADARNQGIARARGRYIAFLDADDEWLPDKLQAQVAAMEAHPEWVLSGTDTLWVFPDGRRPRPSDPPSAGSLGAGAWRSLLANCFLNTSVAMVCTNTIRAVGGFDTALTAGEDQDMWVRLALHGPVGHVNIQGTRVHATPGSVTRTAPRCDATYLIPMVKRHLGAQRHRLSAAEIDRILGARYTTIGRNLYRNGDLLAGADLLFRAMLRRHRIRENVPPVRCLKRLWHCRFWRTRAT